MNYINVAGYQFQNYPISLTTFNPVPGIYVIHSPAAVLDVGIAESLVDRISSHDRKPDWLRHARWEDISLAFLHEPNKTNRLAIESSLRQLLNPLCGER